MLRPSLPFLCFLAWLPSPVAAQDSTVTAYFDSVEAVQPKFEQFPAKAWQGTAATVRLASPKWARRMRTVLREGAKVGPNFAGHFTIVHWGCGSSCQVQAIIDARTGEVFPQTLETMMGASFHLDSDLLLADPVSALRYSFDGDSRFWRCVVCGTPAAYRWDGRRFRPVGPGEHPHLRDD